MKVRKCSKCGEDFSPQGIRLHEKACDGSRRKEADTNPSPIDAPVDISPQETIKDMLIRETDNTQKPPKEEEQAETEAGWQEYAEGVIKEGGRVRARTDDGAKVEGVVQRTWEDAHTNAMLTIIDNHGNYHDVRLQHVNEWVESNEKDTSKEKVSRMKEYTFREGKEGGICPHCGLEFDESSLSWKSLEKNGKDTNLYGCPECDNEFSSPSEVAIPELFDLVGDLKKRFETLENGMVELVEKSMKEGRTESEKARLEQAEEVRTEFTKEIETLKERVNGVVEDEEAIEKTVEERMAGLLQKIDKTDQELRTYQKMLVALESSIETLDARSRKPPCEHDFVDMRKVSGGNYFICSICGEKQEILGPL